MGIKRRTQPSVIGFSLLRNVAYSTFHDCMLPTWEKIQGIFHQYRMFLFDLFFSQGLSVLVQLLNLGHDFFGCHIDFHKITPFIGLALLFPLRSRVNLNRKILFQNALKNLKFLYEKKLASNLL